MVTDARRHPRCPFRFRFNKECLREFQANGSGFGPRTERAADQCSAPLPRPRRPVSEFQQWLRQRANLFDRGRFRHGQRVVSNG